MTFRKLTAATSLLALLALAPLAARATHDGPTTSSDQARHVALERLTPGMHRHAMRPITTTDEARAAAMQASPSRRMVAAAPSSTDQARGIDQ